ncbi:DivIVA domain-containing protein [Arthrobacter sp. M4]|uniref:DivIVA domain-containing protein n=1 Tax=Arthrobacter sp. M4 TaxID=218160 RepID=UPI001CDC64AA|nr:DivIVA domain-containing protein [Arthrobacter sp. M4]MCA4132369.1 DivIVA domain-containing protein [Arthrobacter sp. M4]
MVGVSFFLVFLAIALIGGALFLGTTMSGRERSAGDGLGEPVANLPPVLLPEHATAADIDRIKFSLGLRGYRMDQVDQVLDELRNQLEQRDQEIRQLRHALAGDGHSVDGGSAESGDIEGRSTEKGTADQGTGQ